MRRFRRCALLAPLLALAVLATATGARAVVYPVGSACSTGPSTPTPWYVYNDLNAYEIEICTGGVWALMPVQVGPALESCASGTAGQIQWTGSALQYCNGTSWSAVGAAAASGADGSVQFATSGAFNSDNGLNWDNTGKYFSVYSPNAQVAGLEFSGNATNADPTIGNAAGIDLYNGDTTSTTLGGIQFYANDTGANGRHGATILMGKESRLRTY